MTVGLHAVNLANKWLNVLRNTAFTGITTVTVKLHTGDPGAAGTSNASGTAISAPTITFNAAASGAMTSSNAPQWTPWAVGQNGEVITHISLWDSATFLCSIALTASKTMGTGDTLNLTSGQTSITLTPIAA
jgi:hypothetical protein